MLIYSDNDDLAVPEDVKRLSSELPNVLELRRVDDDTFNHLDFLWAVDAKKLVYDYVIDWMRKMENNETVLDDETTNKVNNEDANTETNLPE